MGPGELWLWRLRRKAADPRWTQRYAARWAGVTERQWRRYETGEQMIPRWLAIRVRNTRPLARQRPAA